MRLARLVPAACVLLALSLGGEASHAQESLVVVTKLTPPFVLRSGDGTWSGPAIHLWQQAAAELGLSYDLRDAQTLAGMLEAVERGEADVAVGALSITAEREVRFDFTHPFHSTGFGIATRVEERGGVAAILSRLVSLPFLAAVGALVLVLLGTGALAYWFEHKKNPQQFGGDPLRGLGSGFWWSAVTMTTVGYGDKAPVTLAGRTLAVIWMFAAVITVSGFTAGIASSLTAEQLAAVNGPEDLGRSRVGTVKASSSESYLKGERIRASTFEHLPEALAKLSHGELDAVVYDLPLLAYEIEQLPERNVAVLPQVLTTQLYAFALRPGSQLRESLNRELPKLTATAEWRASVAGY